MNSTKPPRPLESAVLRECLAIASRMDVPCFRRNVIAVAGEYKGKSRYIKAGEPGQADLYGWLPKWCGLRVGGRPGIHFECEVKRLGETPRLDQVLWLRECNLAGMAAFWADNSRTFQRVLEALCNGKVVVYGRETTMEYRVQIKGSKRTRIVRGPSYEYDLI